MNNEVGEIKHKNFVCNDKDGKFMNPEVVNTARAPKHEKPPKGWGAVSP